MAKNMELRLKFGVQEDEDVQDFKAGRDEAQLLVDQSDSKETRRSETRLSALPN